MLLRCAPSDARRCTMNGIECLPEAVPFPARPWCGTVGTERVVSALREPGLLGVSVDGVGWGKSVLSGHAPPVGGAHDKSALFQAVQSLTEAGVIHAQLLA